MHTQLDELFNWLLIRPILLVPHSSQLLSIASISSLANGSSGSPTSARRTYGLAFELSADSVIDTCCDAAIWKKGPIVSIDTFSRVECTRLAKTPIIAIHRSLGKMLERRQILERHRIFLLSEEYPEYKRETGRSGKTILHTRLTVRKSRGIRGKEYQNRL
ncbi:hypothetical protein BLNAU_17978 [Blattamonas nauphoetae]|uniref:Uncharacterized protein n=1 Tax=Blattamonas nauphoetae TaxID=2049346 RepID=A0ABQ9XA29_9EUKA|nr:hypothetical protein BLNAU_17978 [Blattamonas nauphoetae]